MYGGVEDEELDCSKQCSWIGKFARGTDRTKARRACVWIESFERSYCRSVAALTRSCLGIGANADRLVVQRQQLAARQQSSLGHLLFSRRDDHCRNHLHRLRDHYLRTEGIALDLEIHYGCGLLRFRRRLRSDLRLQSGRYRAVG